MHLVQPIVAVRSHLLNHYSGPNPKGCENLSLVLRALKRERRRQQKEIISEEGPKNLFACVSSENVTRLHEPKQEKKLGPNVLT